MRLIFTNEQTLPKVYLRRLMKSVEASEKKRLQAELNRQKVIKERSLSAHSTLTRVEDARKRKAEIEVGACERNA